MLGKKRNKEEREGKVAEEIQGMLDSWGTAYSSAIGLAPQTAGISAQQQSYDTVKQATEQLSSSMQQAKDFLLSQMYAQIQSPEGQAAERPEDLDAPPAQVVSPQTPERHSPIPSAETIEGLRKAIAENPLYGELYPSALTDIERYDRAVAEGKIGKPENSSSGPDSRDGVLSTSQVNLKIWKNINSEIKIDSMLHSGASPDPSTLCSGIWIWIDHYPPNGGTPVRIAGIKCGVPVKGNGGGLSGIIVPKGENDGELRVSENYLVSTEAEEGYSDSWSFWIRKKIKK